MRNYDRRIRKLEQSSTSAFQTKLNALAHGLGEDQEECLRAVKGHARELDRHIGLDRTITWEGLLLLDGLLRRLRGQPARPPGEFG